MCVRFLLPMCKGNLHSGLSRMSLAPGTQKKGTLQIEKYISTNYLTRPPCMQAWQIRKGRIFFFCTDIRNLSTQISTYKHIASSNIAAIAIQLCGPLYISHVLETCRLSPVLVELLEHPGGLTGSELGHADVGALGKLVSIESKYHAWGD